MDSLHFTGLPFNLYSSSSTDKSVCACLLATVLVTWQAGKYDGIHGGIHAKKQPHLMKKYFTQSKDNCHKSMPEWT